MPTPIRTQEEQERGRQNEWARCLELIEKHLPALRLRRRQLITTDVYGVQDTWNWDREIVHFIDAVIYPNVPWEERYLDREKLKQDIDDLVKSEELDPTPLESMSGRDFEKWCSRVLQECGWHAVTTAASGDQGVDVLAEKENHVLALQCKLFSSGTVGNEAVQQVFAGKVFFKATVAAVVSNAPYSTSARQLALATRVILLHVSELKNIESQIAANLS